MIAHRFLAAIAGVPVADDEEVAILLRGGARWEGHPKQYQLRLSTHRLVLEDRSRRSRGHRLELPLADVTAVRRIHRWVELSTRAGVQRLTVPGSLGVPGLHDEALASAIESARGYALLPPVGGS